MTEGTLKDRLFELKAATEKLIDAVENDNDEVIDGLFISRQKIINEIGKLQYSKEEFTSIATSIDLLQVFNSLEKAVEDKRSELKDKLNDISNAKAANKSYMNNSNAIRGMFNTRV